MTEEKRHYQRYTIWFPVTLIVDGEEVWAICRDASSGGALVSCVSPIDVGTSVQARFRVNPATVTERTLNAIVVRHELNKDELILAFPYRVALEFGEPVPELVAELESQSAKS